ncbi:hypothetical protein ASG47_16370 [Devosia sp. Leaf420]|uniref:nucleotidyltransferase family protein n=1 Tax=Devosia sp. Leaf420 TaxID=1736374 RepID=UPI0007154732|nr:nucleotidyltransferase family protein [Devosia sp. Leaf420]KQT44995.1 hypothetical protein ASG47_16370 [Devosia sp. Leaf420]
MPNHLRFAGADAETQRQALVDIIRADDALMYLLEGLAALKLPDGLLVSGAIYNTVWNVLTKRGPRHGINDADLAYFDASDLSYEAEDRVIRRVRMQLAGSAIPIEVRNQARVHLWFGEKFGIDYPRLSSSAEMLRYFTTKAHAVGARLDRGAMIIIAPFGLDDLFSFRLRPNPVLPNKATHEAKAARALALWPELTFEPWPD